MDDGEDDCGTLQAVGLDWVLGNGIINWRGIIGKLIMRGNFFFFFGRVNETSCLRYIEEIIGKLLHILDIFASFEVSSWSMNGEELFRIIRIVFHDFFFSFQEK